MIKVSERNYYTDEGKVFVHKETNEIYGWGICLGINDSIENYEEIDCPEDKLDDPAYNKAVNDKIHDYKGDTDKLSRVKRMENPQ